MSLWWSLDMSEWENEKLGDLVTFQKGKKVTTSVQPLSGYLKYLGAGSLNGKSVEFASTSNAILANPNDVLMLWDGERSGLVGCGLEGVVSSTVSKLSPNQKIIGKYLYFILAYNFSWIQNRRTGTGIPHVPKDLNRILKIYYPKNKNRQKKIATILSTIDTAIEKTQELIDKYQQIKTGLMHDLFTRGIGENGKLRPPRNEAPDLYKESELGWIPKEWEVNSIDYFCDVFNYFRFPIAAEIRETMKGAYPYYGPTGIVDFINEYRLNGQYVLIGEDGDHFLKSNKMEMTQLLNGKFNVNNHAHILKGKNNCSDEWFYTFYMNRDITFWLTRQGAGR